MVGVKWALDGNNAAAEQALENLMLDWPFDFHYFEGDDAQREEQIMKHIINLPAATERLRDFCGLDSTNLMRMAGEVCRLLQKQSGSKPGSEEVHAWRSDPKHIRWGVYHAPSMRNVKDLLKKWDAIQEVPAVLVIIDKARTVFGRDNLFDFTSKITLIMDKTKQDPVLVR